MKSENPRVLIVMGSDSDLEVMERCAKTLQKFNVPYEMTIASAHRSPARAAELARTARERALQAEKPACVHVMTDPTVTSPATVMFEQALKAE